MQPDAPRKRTRAILAIGVMAMLAFAGCAGQTDAPTDEEVSSEPAPTETERRFQAERTGANTTGDPDGQGAYDNDDWFLLSAPRAPDGHVRAFHWRLPPGAVQAAGDGFRVPTFFMEIVPVQDAFAPGEDWALFAFHDDDGAARLVFALLGPTVTEENLTTDPPTRATRPPPSGSGVLFYGDPGLEPEDDLYFVLVAHGTSGETGFALRTARGTPQQPPRAAQSLDAFVATEPDPPRVPRPVWDGTGDHMAFYAERLVGEEDRRRVWTDTIEHSVERQDPADGGGRASRIAIASSAETGPGWSLVYATHQASAETVWWTIDIAAQGVSRQANGVTANDPVGATGAVLARANGVPEALFMADGDGASHVRFTLEGAGGDLGEGTVVQHHRLPVSLEQMIGVPSMTVDGLYQGDAGGLPWIGPLPAG